MHLQSNYAESIGSRGCDDMSAGQCVAIDTRVVVENLTQSGELLCSNQRPRLTGHLESSDEVYHILRERQSA